MLELEEKKKQEIKLRQIQIFSFGSSPFIITRHWQMPVSKV